jgi:anti-sigma factor RsiW
MTARAGDRCRRLRERVSRFIDGELPPAERRTLAAHLRRCPGCRTMADGLRHTVELCREAGSVRLPSDVSRRARARVSTLLAGGKRPSPRT